jgi:enoyl-CoA hydratase/carnithine racemase
MGGDFISAHRAEQIGLYERVVPDDQVLDVATRIAEYLAQGPREALAATKDALDREWAMDLESALAHEAETQALLMQGPDFAEGYAAFAEKRPPRFP